MVRITKDPEVRRRELVLAACRLFREKGFEQVSVSDIVKTVGVAQGTFYYYFETKYDILDAVMDHYTRKSLDVIGNIAADDGLDAMEKLQAVLTYSSRMGESGKNFIEFLHSDDNLIAHQKYLVKSFEKAIPLITGIVEEGIREGLFDVQYPRETVELLVYMNGMLHDSLYNTADRDEYYRKMRATEAILVRVLGIKAGRLRMAPEMADLHASLSAGDRTRTGGSL